MFAHKFNMKTVNRWAYDVPITIDMIYDLDLIPLKRSYIYV